MGEPKEVLVGDVWQTLPDEDGEGGLTWREAYCDENMIRMSLEARIKALEQERDALHAALTVFEATWDTGGCMEPDDFWEKCWPAVDRLVPPEHQLLTWAVAQQERERAALREDEDE
jgi:hypothetical protein